MTTADRVLLVTGTSTGIGQATAVRAAAAGWRVVATMRDPSRQEALDDPAIEVVPLDVTDEDSVAACFEAVRRTHGRLDAVVNNAGISNFDPTMEMSTLAALRTALEVNFVGMVAVSRLAMPLLRASRGRLVSIGSVHGVVGQPFNEAYAAAKFAVEGFLESLAPTAAGMGVTVVIVEPGPVLHTSFASNSGVTRESLLIEAGPYADVLRPYLEWVVRTGYPGVQTAKEVAEIVVRALTDPDPAFRIATSDWVREYAAIKYADPDGSVVQALTRSWLVPVEPSPFD